MKGKVKDFLDNPAGFHINNNGVLDFGMSDIPKGRIGKGAFSCGKLGMKCSLDLAACVLGKPFVEQILERNEIGQALLGIRPWATRSRKWRRALSQWRTRPLR